MKNRMKSFKHFNMKNLKISSLCVMLLFFMLLNSCNSQQSGSEPEKVEIDSSQNESEFVAILEKHLNAVSNKDLISLKSTMSPEGKMQLILPGTEIMHSVDSFMEYHEEWFQDTSWTFETKILNTEIGDKIGIAITEIVYREPDRNGEPYFNRMIVSYGLEKYNDQWYIIKDHASSIEKSTDKK